MLYLCILMDYGVSLRFWLLFLFKGVQAHLQTQEQSTTRVEDYQLVAAAREVIKHM